MVCLSLSLERDSSASLLCCHTAKAPSNRQTKCTVVAATREESKTGDLQCTQLTGGLYRPLVTKALVLRNKARGEVRTDTQTHRRRITGAAHVARLWRQDPRAPPPSCVVVGRPTSTCSNNSVGPDTQQLQHTPRWHRCRASLTEIGAGRQPNLAPTLVTRRAMATTAHAVQALRRLLQTALGTMVSPRDWHRTG